MTYEQLVEWCGYFWNPEDHDCGCGCWHAGQQVNGQECRVLAAGNAAFVPEPIRGNPMGKDVLFLAANPGGGADEDRAFCPWYEHAANQPGERWDGILQSLASFASYHIHSNEMAAVDERTRSGYVGDGPSRAAAGIVAALQGHRSCDIPVVPEVETPWFTDYIASVALLNVAHCKSPHWPEDAGANGVACEDKSFELLYRMRPRVAVAFGVEVWHWFARIVNRRREWENWRIEYEQSIRNCHWGDLPKWGASAMIRWGAGDMTTVVSAYHPSKRNTDRGRYSPEHVGAVVATIRAILIP